MEMSENWEGKPLINELIQGRELTKQLRIHLNPSSPIGELLIKKILSSFDNTLSMINKNGFDELFKPTIGMFESPHSSPRSDDTDRGDTSKKRKTSSQWTQQIQVCSGPGLEGPLEDGYSWRKYGQKDILGAKYPRGYYRCTYRNVQGCLATKQVQRSENNPSMFDVTYRGRHTCIQTFPQTRPTQNPYQEDQKQKQKQKQEQEQEQEQQKQKQTQETLLNFKTGLEFRKFENFDTPEPNFFTFPSSSIEGVKIDNNHIFSSSMLDNNFMGSFSPPFISPTTSESQCKMNGFGGGLNLQTSESDPTEIISATTSSSNSPIVDLGFTLDSFEFEPNFQFSNSDFFN